MSSYFRIVINLSNFFTDHRRQARICVNNTIQTIGDLQNKISNIFNIHGFYLVCDNDFLPPSEDIHVLQSNDLVCVMPGTISTQQSGNMHSTPLYHSAESRSFKQNCNETKKKVVKDIMSDHFEAEDIPKKKKPRLTANGVDNNIQEIVVSEKKYKHILTENEATNNIQDVTPGRKNKKEKRITANGVYNIDQEIVSSEREKKDKHKATANGTDNSFTEVIVPERKKKKKKNRFMKFMECDDSFTFENSEADKSKKKKKNDFNETNILEPTKTENSDVNDKKEHEKKAKTSLSTNTDSNQIVCKGDLASYTKKQPVPTITNEYLKERMVNIVRIDYITTGNKSKNSQSQNSKSKANVQLSNSPKVSLLTNTSPVKFAPEFTCIEQSNSVCSQKSSNIQHTDFLNKNEHDMKMKTEMPKPQEFIKEPPEKCTASETQFENAMIIDNQGSAQKCELGVESINNLQTENTIPSEGSIVESRIYKQNIDPDEHKRDIKDSREESGIVSGGTELNILNNNHNQQTFTRDIKTPENKEWSYKEVSPLSESLLAGFTSSVLESTHSIVVEDIYEKSPFVSGCHWVQSENRTAKPKHKELSGVGQILENLRTAPDVKPDENVSDLDSFVTFRKRKRSRRRTKKNRFEIDDSLTLPPQTVPMPKPMITEAIPSIHIKFDEDGKEDLINSKKENQTCSIVSDNTNGKIYLESPSQMIEKATPMKDTVPKVGDTIGFKVLKMSASYTPEVSEYVIGKVMKYSPSDGSIKFDIIVGLEELKEPKGKLSIPENDGVYQNRHKVYTWTELIEPILYS